MSLWPYDAIVVSLAQYTFWAEHAEPTKRVYFMAAVFAWAA